MPSLPPALVDWAQVVSAALSFLAIALALFAIWKSSEDIANERRTTHELQVLRDLSDAIEDFGPGVVPRIRSCLFLLQGSEDLPMVRAAVAARARDRDLRTFQRRYPGAPAPEEPTNRLAIPATDRFYFTRNDGTAAEELDQAIQRRLTD